MHLLIGGDIGEADSIGAILSELDNAVQVPIYFVLGNHDFNHGSIAAVRRRVGEQVASSARLHWLPAEAAILLTADAALIGHDSWADGRLGNFLDSTVEMNDYLLIEELRGLPKPELLVKLNALGDEAALFLEARAREALAQRSHILVLTHVPPFRDSCWHQGRISNSNWLPHFAWKTAGERLAALMRKHPENAMTILCGHTHGAGFTRILENLSVFTGGAEYGYPQLQRVFDLS